DPAAPGTPAVERPRGLLFRVGERDRGRLRRAIAGRPAPPAPANGPGRLHEPPRSAITGDTLRDARRLITKPSISKFSPKLPRTLFPAPKRGSISPWAFPPGESGEERRLPPPMGPRRRARPSTNSQKYANQ